MTTPRNFRSDRRAWELRAAASPSSMQSAQLPDLSDPPDLPAPTPLTVPPVEPAPQPPPSDMAQSTEAVATLKAMFPEVEPAVLESVLESVSNNLEPAVEALLMMTQPDAAAAQQNAGGPPPEDTENDAALAAQLAQDEELARQLQQQVMFEQEFDEQARLHQAQQQMSNNERRGDGSFGAPWAGGRGRGGGGAQYPGQQGGGYPGQPGAYHPSVYRPNQWGADGPAPAEQESGSIGETLSSWWNWVTGDDESGAERRKRRGGEDAAGGGSGDGQHESHEMVPIRTVRDVGQGERGERSNMPRATLALPGSDHLSSNPAGSAGFGSVEGDDETDVMIRDRPSSGDGAVRRRAPRPPQGPAPDPRVVD